MLKMNEINKLDAKAIEKKVTELKRELFEVKFQKQTSTLEKPHLLKILKKDIARLLTVKNSK